MNVEKNSRGLLRVVLNTNVYISFLNFSGVVLGDVWRLALERKYILLVSPDIIKEVARVLRLDFYWQEKAIADFLKVIVGVSEFITPSIIIDIIQTDPSDNRIIECAVAGKADIIVSGDKHLKQLKSFENISIIQPVDFLKAFDNL